MQVEAERKKRAAILESEGMDQNNVIENSIDIYIQDLILTVISYEMYGTSLWQVP